MKLLASVILSTLACSAADLYPVAGTVVNAQTRAALPHAQVYLFRPGVAKPVTNMTTGDDGRFRLDVPEGTYRMVAGTRVHAQNYGSKYADEGFGSAVIVGPTHDTANLTFRWFPTAAVYGRITDDTGEPVENALVQLLRSSVAAGRRVTRSAGFIRTNDLGEYRFGSIPGDARYYLSVSGNPWYSALNQFIPAQRDPNAERPAAFVPVFYPNVTDPSRAVALTPKPGEEVRADFALARAVGARVTVKHDVPADKPVTVNLVRSGIGGVDSYLDPVQIPNIGGKFRPDPVFTDVPPGRYTVHVTSGTPGADAMEGLAVIDVNGSDMTTEVTVHPAGTVTGTLRWVNPGDAPRGSVVVGLTYDAGVIGFNTPVRPDGSFIMRAVLTGKYRPVVRNTGSYLVDVQVDGSPNSDGSFKLSPGDSAKISVTASAEVGEVKGFVMNGDKPVDAVLTVIASATDSDEPYRHQGYQTESDGSFDFKYIPPGRYYLFAVEDTALEYANPAVIKSYLASAKAITVEAHGSATERIPLTSAPQ